MDYFLYFIIFIISIIQSVAGVGILVLGTPILLILDFSIIDSMFFLLPISIFSSLGNLIFINFAFNIKNQIDLKLIKYFFIFCFPFVCIGLTIMKNLNELINFNILVSLIIIISMIIKIKFEKFFLNLTNNLKKIITIFIGLIHGFTNSGGTLLSLFIINREKQKINFSRFQIHLFYFFLAFTQLIVLYFLAGNEFKYHINLYVVFLIVLMSCFIGNRVISINQNLVSYLIYFLAIISSVILFIKGI